VKAREERIAALAAALLFSGACRAPSVDPEAYERSPDRPEAIAPRDLEELHRARDAWDRGDLAAARGILERVARDEPDDVSIAVLAQEAAFAPATDEERERMIASAREGAEREPTLVALLLAARIEPEPERRRDWIQRALAIAPADPWALYALAHHEARAGNWAAAQRRLEKTLELDPGHRAARRLEAALLARSGDNARAIDALETWIAETAGDPRLSAETRVTAALDLAHLLVLSREDARAREVLLDLGDVDASSVRRWCLLAAAELGLGKPGAALAAAREAQGIDASAVTPLVQEAILMQHHLEDREAARAAWREVLDAVGGDPGLGALIQGLRARVVLERMGVPAEP
jgi:tetratricopeptide (TPR) repeat protein